MHANRWARKSENRWGGSAWKPLGGKVHANCLKELRKVHANRLKEKLKFMETAGKQFKFMQIARKQNESA